MTTRPQFKHGSAPRVRGTHRCIRAALQYLRFSPACAGNTLLECGGSYFASVQPRVCGEHCGNDHSDCINFGSAPRVRGTFRHSTPQIPARRFSPACAGNIQLTCVEREADSVQPRVCGEHNSMHVDEESASGSAPRVRGTFIQIKKRHYPNRFSPACAGNIITRAQGQQVRAVQPRVCGEHPCRI